VSLGEYVALIVWVPLLTAVGVYVTEQLEVVPLPTWLRLHGLAVNFPLPLLVRLAVPGGKDRVPLSVSETVTVHVVL
jgi:hypothetical protein